MRGKHLIIIIALVFAFWGNITVKSYASEDKFKNNKKNVLYINSYSPNSIAFDKQLSGIL
ncbi:MAG: hypothetical protein RSD22_00670 [Romboutsia sp.]